jgi:general secretion pathway protein J
MPRASCSRSMGGFTLVEVLVALLVMALMAAMAWQGVDGIVRSRDASQRRLEATLRLNTVIAQWEQDLASLQDTANVPALSFDGATLRLTRRVPQGIQLVAWALRNDGTGAIWQRWASPAHTTRAELQDAWLRSQQFQGQEPGQLRVLDGVLQWQVYFYRGNAWSNAQSSAGASASPAAAPAPAPPASAASAPAGTPSQAPTAGQPLPSGVRLVLEFAPGSGLAGSLVRDTMLGP